MAVADDAFPRDELIADVERAILTGGGDLLKRVRQDDLLARLAAMLADLQGYVERRAGGLAAPHIAEAGRLAGEEIAAARREQQRAEDLATELRRQRDTVERHRDRHRAAVQRVEQLTKLKARPDGYDQAVIDCQSTIGCSWDEAHWLTAMAMIKDALKEPSRD